MEAFSKMGYVLVSEIEIPQETSQFFISGEKGVSAYKTFRDYVVFTNKRIIIVDLQGLTGKKKEIYSVPYKSVLMWSTENAGKIDLTAEVQVWTRVGMLKIKLSKGVDVRKFEVILSNACL